MGQDGSKPQDPPTTPEGRRARLDVTGSPIPRRSFRPSAAFGVVIPGDVSAQTAVRLHATELEHRARLVQMFDRQLRRLEEIAESRLTMRSTDAAIASAMLQTAKYLDALHERLAQLAPADPEQQVDGILSKLAFLTAELKRVRGGKRTYQGRRPVPTDAELVEPEPAPSTTTSGVEPPPINPSER